MPIFVAMFLCIFFSVNRIILWKFVYIKTIHFVFLDILHNKLYFQQLFTIVMFSYES